MLVLLAGTLACAGQVVRASEVVKELSSQIGVPIELAQPLRQDLMFVETHGAAPATVLAAVAEALHASIRSAVGRLVIGRTKTDLENFRLARTTERTLWLTRRIEHVSRFRTAASALGSPDTVFFDALKHQRDQIREFSKGNVIALDPFYPEQVMPSEVLLEALATRIGLRSLADLPSGQVRVYEDEPKGREQPLPPHDDLLAAFEQAMKPIRRSTISSSNLDLLQRYHVERLVADWVEERPVSRLKLIEDANENRMLLSLVGYDSLGHQVTSASLDAGPVDGNQTPHVLMVGLSKKPGLRWVALSQAAIEAWNFACGERRAERPAWFERPDKAEPLNLFVKEALAGIAAIEPTKPVVIAVSDALWSNVRQCVTDGQINLDGLEATMQQWTPYEQLNSRDAVVWRPKDVEIDELRRADRRELAGFVGEFAATGHARLKTVARLYHNASLEDSPLATAWLFQAQMAAGAAPQISCSFGQGFYRVLGAIPDEEWELLTSGQTLAVGELGVGLELESFLLHAEYLKPEAVNGTSDADRSTVESVANGILADTPISLAGTDRPGIKTWPAGRPEPDGSISVEQLMQRFYIRWQSFRWDGDTPSLPFTREEFESQYASVQFRYCRQPTSAIRIRLTRGMLLRGEISGNSEPASEPFGYVDFPQAFRDAAWKHAYEAGLADARRMRASPQSQQNGQVQPIAQPSH